MISLWILVILAVGYLVYRQLFSKPTLPGRLPPGPKPLPIIGNLGDLPPAGKPEHEHWLKHKDLYGPVSSVTVLGRQIIILHSREAIQELMEKTSLKTSGRPALEFGYMCGYDEYFSLHQYTETFRLNRKFVHKQLGTKELILRYQGVLETEVAHLLLRALETPQHLIQHFRRYLSLSWLQRRLKTDLRSLYPARLRPPSSRLPTAILLNPMGLTLWSS
jgi:hypothetical protein